MRYFKHYLETHIFNYVPSITYGTVVIAINGEIVTDGWCQQTFDYPLHRYTLSIFICLRYL